MKRRKQEVKKKEEWAEFEKRVGLKRLEGQDKKSRGGSNAKVPSDILVQRMSSTASGRLKKYEPLDTRDFVPFEDYDELTIDNIKDACERFYNAPQSTCDILASDRGPSCTKLEQIKGKKVFFIRFLPPENESLRSDNIPIPGKERNDVPKRAKSSPIKFASSQTAFSPRAPATVFPKSVSIGDLLKAGKLIKPPKTSTFNLELFDVYKCQWVNASTITLRVNDEKFASGAFRDAYKAECLDPPDLRGNWVLKWYQDTSKTTIETTLRMSVEDHTRKQVQMHAVARNITQQFAFKAPQLFNETFSYGKVFYSTLDGQPVTVEEYVPGDFVKYVNNDGSCLEPPNEDYEVVFRKAECLVHFSYEYSNKKMMLVDIQGSMFNLYDPEIATANLMPSESDDQGDVSHSGELYFCAGNLSHITISKFKSEHKCSQFCAMLNLTSETELSL